MCALGISVYYVGAACMHVDIHVYMLYHVYNCTCMYTCVGYEHRVNMCVWYELEQSQRKEF